MSPIKVEIIQTSAGFQLLRDGKPYRIYGAGMGDDDIEKFASHGGNSIRNWTTDGESQDTLELLNSAHKHGVTVALCLTMQAERWGFDYDDDEAIANQLATMRREVIKYKDHPALLFWIIGNELNHGYTNSKVYDAVDDVAQMIDELDSNHPTTTAISGMDPAVIEDVLQRAPNVDFLSFQLYGELFALPKRLKEAGFEKPFMVTEWGAIGYWEVDTTKWQAPIESNSSEKAATFMRGQREILDSIGGQLLGSYAFLWGQKQERTPTWFGMFTEDGEETEVVDVMHYLWTGAWPSSRAPQIESLKLNGQDVRSSVSIEFGASMEASAEVVDPNGDALTFVWELKPESGAVAVGGDFEERIANLDGYVENPGSLATVVNTPPPGLYRLFFYAKDGKGHAAHANFPFRVVHGVEQLIDGEVMAVAYSGFREGQHPDRGNGAKNPSDAEILQDLELLVEHDFNLIRLYDSGENSRSTLELIREHALPIKVLLGAWLDAEVSNHEGCPWLDEPIPQSVLKSNVLRNADELQRTIDLATQFSDIVVAVNVGNEALVEWNDHMVSLDAVVAYVQKVKKAIEQPVTVADNYEWWLKDGAPLVEEVDFIGVHTYPLWEGKSIDEALAYTIENIDAVRGSSPSKPIAVLEAGWATTASEFGDRASEVDQDRYFRQIQKWGEETNTTVFFFEAFDEPWKGDVDNPLGAEKHWGIFNVDRTPKAIVKR